MSSVLDGFVDDDRAAQLHELNQKGLFRTVQYSM